MKIKKVDIYANGAIASEEEMKAVLIRANFERQRQQQLQLMANDLASANNRARAVSVGTAFGGAIEVSLRRPDGVSTYAILQPVEALETIHQLAAACGCHIHIQPRKDFSSWREWRHVDPGEGHPPHTAYTLDNWEKAIKIPSPEQQPGLQPALMAKEKQDEQAVATEKTLKRRSTKRATTTA